MTLIIGRNVPVRPDTHTDGRTARIIYLDRDKWSNKVSRHKWPVAGQMHPF